MGRMGAFLWVSLERDGSEYHGKQEWRSVMGNGSWTTEEDRQRLSFRLRAFVLLRVTLIVASSYLILAQYDFQTIPFFEGVLVLLGLFSNLVLWWLPRSVLSSPRFLAVLVVADTLWIAALLVLAGRFDPEFFYLFFFVVLLAAIGENLFVILLGTAAACVAYFLVVYATLGKEELLAASTLIRVPFLISVAGFYGYLVDRIRRERQKAASEALIVEELRKQQRKMEEINARLAREIEDRKRIEEELQRASEMKSVFVSTVSHELRTPLTSIKNAVDLLAPSIECLDEPQRRFLTIARKNIERLGLIIGDLLEISSIEAGKIRCRFEETDPARFLEPVVVSLDEEAKRKSLALELQMDDDIPLVWADSQRMEQVVMNLLSNAIKFTPEGGQIVVRARRIGDEVEISVSDSGIGLSAEDQQRVFEPFFQAGDPLTDRARGTGLGLAISWNLVAAHGSELRVESEPGKGSRFVFNLSRASDGAREKTALEDAIREFMAFPFFSLLVVTPSRDLEGGGTLGSGWMDKVGTILTRVLPRSGDRLIFQPALGRIVIVLLGTGGDGGSIVRQRVAEAIESTGELTAAVWGPAVYPEDGATGFQLIRAAVARSTDGGS